MKNLAVIGLSVVMLLGLNLTALGSTVFVDVEKGFSVELSKQLSPATDEIIVYANYGFNEQLSAYTGYGTDSQSIILGCHYVFYKDMAVALEYVTAEGSNVYTVSFMAKSEFSDHLNVAGEFDYETPSETVSILGQLEYKLGEMAVLNGGVQYDKNVETSNTYIVIGTEFYPLKPLTVALDYSYNIQSNDDSALTLDISFAF